MASETTSGVNGVSLYTSDGAGTATRVSTANPLPTSSGAPVAADIVHGYQTFTVTTGATTLLTVAAGETWVGTIGANCTAIVAAASASTGRARAVFATAGTGVTPAAGTFFAVESTTAANAATGTVGGSSSQSQSIPLTIIAPVGNAVTVTVATTQAGTASIVDAWASGRYV